MGPLSRKACVKQWKSNGKIAVSMCDHYGVEAQKKKHGEGKMMPSKIEALMWDHYRVKHA